MLKVTAGSAMLGAPSLMSFTVFAASGEQEPSVPLNRDDLSLYAAPQQQKLRYVEPEVGQLEQNVATVRKTLEPYTLWWQQHVYGNIKPRVQSVIQCGCDAYTYLKDPPSGFYAQVGIIGATGVLGLFLAGRSRIKRVIYPVGLVTIGASLYYPEKAAATAKSAGDSVYDWALKSYLVVEKTMKKPEKKAEKPTEEKP